MPIPESFEFPPNVIAVRHGGKEAKGSLATMMAFLEAIPEDELDEALVVVRNGEGEESEYPFARLSSSDDVLLEEGW